MIEICRWPDGTWCDVEDIEQYSFMSDDYEVVNVTYEEYEGL